MDWINTKLVDKIVRALRKDPEALLVFALALLVLSASVWAEMVALGCGVVVVLYIVYNFRAYRREQHAERMEQLKIERLDAQRGKPLRVKARGRLALEKKGDKTAAE